MKITILGCGTSTGVPVIGCCCGVCSSEEPRNKRTRASILVETGGRSILVDTSTDLREQALRSRVMRVDAILYTHHHADHLHGIDDLRAFNRLQKEETIPCYGDRPTMERIESYFEYIFHKTGSKNNGWKPNLSSHVVDAPFEISGVKIIPVEIFHGEATILGFRIGALAYLTDCSSIPDSSMELLRGTELLIVGALRDVPHPSHFSIQQALEASAEIGSERTLLTHLGHGIEYNEVGLTLPAGTELAYDGMVVEL